MRRVFFILVAILSSFLSLSGCMSSDSSNLNSKDFISNTLKENDIDSVKNLNRVISISFSETFKDKTTIKGTQKRVINMDDMKIMDRTEQGNNNTTYYYNIKGNKVDIYMYNEESKESVVNKDVDINQTVVNNINSSFSMDGNPSDYKLVAEERLDGVDIVKLEKISKSDSIKKIENILNSEEIAKNNDLKNAIESSKRGYKTYYYIDKNNYKLLRVSYSSLYERKIFYYANNPNGENPPIESKFIADIEYKTEKINIKQ